MTPLAPPAPLAPYHHFIPTYAEQNMLICCLCFQFIENIVIKI